MSSIPTILVPSPDSARPKRLQSLDQFRGYTVLAMLLVNYFGNYAVCPQLLRHSNDYCSYADTIMPQFLFAVGFALRLTFGRRELGQGASAAYGRIVRRLCGLILISLVVYNVSPRAENWSALVDLGWWDALAEPLKRGWFQTLMHIAVTSMWILPVIRADMASRAVWLVGSAFLHMVLSYWFNFNWIYTAPSGIDGGPLGFLTWTIPALVGTMACDWFVPPTGSSPSRAPRLGRCLLWSFGLMGLGWVLSCGTRWYDVPAGQVDALRATKLASDPVWPNSQRVAAKQTSAWHAWLAEPPFVRPPQTDDRKWNYWMMSQRVGTLSYLTFSSGVALLVYWLFYIACDRWGWQLGIFRTFGTNAILAYVLHMMVINAVHPFFPEDSPAWYALSGLSLFMWVNWIFVRHFEKQGIYLRV